MTCTYLIKYLFKKKELSTLCYSSKAFKIFLTPIFLSKILFLPLKLGREIKLPNENSWRLQSQIPRQYFILIHRLGDASRIYNSTANPLSENNKKRKNKKQISK